MDLGVSVVEKEERCSSSTVGRLEGQTLLGSGLQAPALSLKGGWEEGITQRECHNLLYNKLHKQ